MTPMDVKGVSWVGHMCQKFEALCVDVDEAIYEDTFIYVGNQMRTVGESVKKFYTDVVQDLLSSSSLDSAKGKDAHNTVELIDGARACKKQALDSGVESVETASETTGNSSDDAATVEKSVICDPCSSAEEPSTPVMFHNQSTDSVSSKSSTAKSDVHRGQQQEDQLKSSVEKSVICDPCLSVEEPPTPVMFPNQSTESVSSKSSTAKSDVHRGQQQEDQLKSSCDAFLTESVKEFSCNDSHNESEVFFGNVDTASIIASAAGMLESNKDNGKISRDMIAENSSTPAEEETQTKGTCIELDNLESSLKAASDITVTDNVQDAVEVDAMFLASDFDTETSRCWLDDETKAAAVNKDECLKLEESCVLVENDVHFSTFENAQKSYKKKLKAVFSPRKWAKPRRDQDKFSGKHGEQIGKSTKIRNSSTSVSLDSEWELL